MRIKKVVDERQELELLKIEHVVFWIMFWGLWISIIVQSMFMDVPFQQILPEFVILMIGCVGTLIGCVKKGQWDYFSHPSLKTYAITAAIGSMVIGLIFGISLYFRDVIWNDYLLLLILFIAVVMLCMFAAIFGLSALIGNMVKKKRKRLADAYSDDDSDE